MERGFKDIMYRYYILTLLITMLILKVQSEDEYWRTNFLVQNSKMISQPLLSHYDLSRWHSNSYGKPLISSQNQFLHNRGVDSDYFGNNKRTAPEQRRFSDMYSANNKYNLAINRFKNISESHTGTHLMGQHESKNDNHQHGYDLSDSGTSDVKYERNFNVPVSEQKIYSHLSEAGGQIKYSSGDDYGRRGTEQNYFHASGSDSSSREGLQNSDSIAPSLMNQQNDSVGGEIKKETEYEQENKLQNIHRYNGKYKVYNVRYGNSQSNMTESEHRNDRIRNNYHLRTYLGNVTNKNVYISKLMDTPERSEDREKDNFTDKMWYRYSDSATETDREANTKDRHDSLIHHLNGGTIQNDYVIKERGNVFENRNNKDSWNRYNTKPIYADSPVDDYWYARYGDSESVIKPRVSDSGKTRTWLEISDEVSGNDQNESTRDVRNNSSLHSNSGSRGEEHRHSNNTEETTLNRYGLGKVDFGDMWINGRATTDGKFSQETTTQGNVQNRHDSSYETGDVMWHSNFGNTGKEVPEQEDSKWHTNFGTNTRKEIPEQEHSKWHNIFRTNTGKEIPEQEHSKWHSNFRTNTGKTIPEQEHSKWHSNFRTNTGKTIPEQEHSKWHSNFRTNTGKKIPEQEHSKYNLQRHLFNRDEYKPVNNQEYSSGDHFSGITWNGEHSKGQHMQHKEKGEVNGLFSDRRLSSEGRVPIYEQESDAESLRSQFTAAKWYDEFQVPTNDDDNYFKSVGNQFGGVRWNNERVPINGHDEMTIDQFRSSLEHNVDNKWSSKIQIPKIHELSDATIISGTSWNNEGELPVTEDLNNSEMIRNPFSNIGWNSNEQVPTNDELNDGEVIRNLYSGSLWQPHLHVPTTDELSDSEVMKNNFNANKWYDFTEGDVLGNRELSTGTRIASSPPTVVSTYTLPNGTRVVRYRRIIRFRKPQTLQSTTFGDYARGIFQKKVAKFLSLFTIIQFANEPCRAAEGINGTCYHNLECKSLGGVASGPCARGYGVCCYFQRSCGDTIRQNCSYFVNPGFPSPITNMLACVLSVEKAHPDVSQIRLDFFTLELLGPTNGTCIEDQFIVTRQNTNSIAPIICGINNGQHIYIDVDNATGPIQLNTLIMGGDQPRTFRIKVTQIKRGTPLEAPRNCLQYHRGVRGTIESFNYQATNTSNLPTRPGYMNNLNYAICIHKEPGFCTITYTNTDPFQLLNADQDGQPLIPPGQAGAEIFNCPDDYIVINGIRLCGERLNDAAVEIDFTKNAPVTDTSNGPFIVPVRTNGNINGRGFKIDYMQNSCAS